MLLTCSIFAVSINQSSNGMKSYNKKFVYFICLVSAMGGLLFGYDWVVIGGAKPFYELYFDIADVPAMQGLAMSVALLGCLIGAMVAGMMADRYGRKPLLIISAFIFLSSAYATGAFSAFSWFLAARFLGGIGIGIASGLSPMYIAEVAPTSIRGKLVSLNQLTIVLGILGAQITNWLIAEPIPADFSPVDICASWNGQMGWRWMFWAAAFPAAIFLLLACFIPESPRWLILRNRTEGAHAVLQRIYRSSEAADGEIASIRSAEAAAPKSEWRALTSPGMRKALLIGVAIAMLGQFMGVNAVLYYGPTIFEDAGLSSGDSLFSQVLVGVVNMLTTVLALVIIDRVGRKQLVYWGVSGMILSLLCIGVYFLAGAAWGLSPTFLLVFFLAYVFCCAVSISAVIFVLLSEMYPTRIRGMAMSIAGFALWIGTYLVGQLTPWMLQNLTPTGTFLLFALMCVPYMLIVWKLIPETTGKSLEEIERYWMKKR